jgi:hypothetical protein
MKTRSVQADRHKTNSRNMEHIQCITFRALCVDGRHSKHDAFASKTTASAVPSGWGMEQCGRLSFIGQDLSVKGSNPVSAGSHKTNNRRRWSTFNAFGGL